MVFRSNSGYRDLDTRMDSKGWRGGKRNFPYGTVDRAAEPSRAKSPIRTVTCEGKKNGGTRLPGRKLTKQVDIKGARAMQIDEGSHVIVRDFLFDQAKN